MSWPTIDDAATFTSQSATDATLQWALDASIQYGKTVLGSVVVDGLEVPVEPDDSVFHACLDYAGSLYTQRIGASDVVVDAYGTTPQQRYRRVLLASRYVGFA